jgi:hypothetical protein
MVGGRFHPNLDNSCWNFHGVEGVVTLELGIDKEERCIVDAIISFLKSREPFKRHKKTYQVPTSRLLINAFELQGLVGHFVIGGRLPANLAT